jgi:hypothetical protein
MSKIQKISKPRRKQPDVSVMLHVTGEPTDGWCAEVTQLLVDLVGPWQALASGGVRRRARCQRPIGDLCQAGGNVEGAAQRCAHKFTQRKAIGVGA